MNKWIDLPVPLLRNLKVEAAANDTTLGNLCGEILQNFLDNEVPIVAPADNRTKILVKLPETDWEQARAVAREAGISIYRAFESSAVQLGYLKPAAV